MARYLILLLFLKSADGPRSRRLQDKVKSRLYSASLALGLEREVGDGVDAFFYSFRLHAGAEKDKMRDQERSIRSNAAI